MKNPSTRWTRALALLAVALLAACNQNPGDPAAGPVEGAADNKQPAAISAPRQFSVIEMPAIDKGLIARCSVDMIGKQKSRGQTIPAQSGGIVRLSGWVADPGRRVPAQFTVVLMGTENYGVTGTAGIKRSDVARVFSAPALADAGFRVQATLGPVAAGEYAVGILFDHGGKKALCTTNTRLAVGPAAG